MNNDEHYVIVSSIVLFLRNLDNKNSNEYSLSKAKHQTFETQRSCRDLEGFVERLVSRRAIVVWQLK